MALPLVPGQAALRSGKAGEDSPPEVLRWNAFSLCQPAGVRHVWHPCTRIGSRHEAAPPVTIAHACGPWLWWTPRSRRYILDGISSLGANRSILFGHSHPHIRAALTENSCASSIM